MAKSKVKTKVELGFLESVEETESQVLKSHYFPSKVGGRPAWLSLSPLPTDLCCHKCRKSMVFLFQVYAPVTEQLDCFHRTIFCFVCRDPSCCQKNSNLNFRVYRSQLPRQNKFYSFEPPSDKRYGAENVLDASAFQELCVVCGAAGPKRCSKCHKASYCGKEHQTVDWKTIHKKMCSAEGSKVNLGVEYPNILFPEFEIVTETEEIQEENKDRSDSEKMQDYDKFLKSDDAKTLMKETPAADFEAMASKEGEKDQMFLEFKKRTAKEPEQILRYNKGGEPLWVSEEHIPGDEDIPKCSCGAKRQYEFQVLPQLLNNLAVDQLGDSIDWGTLCVYTCRNNCHIGNNYQEEFLWKQDFSSEKS